MRIRPMMAHDEFRVRETHEICHPGWPARPEHWYFIHPTLVAVEGTMLLGFTSFAISELTGIAIEHGADVCVRPEAQGIKLGARLHDARVDIGRAAGARMFSGVTQPDNAPMIRIFLARGYHHCQTMPRAFPDGRDGHVYVGPIGEK
jgi:GNAT superfamily N-acetyltransferase